MLRLALCDDDPKELHHCSALLDQYQLTRNVDITYTAFQSPLELLTAIEHGIHYDILFLDIVMPGINGITTAEEIRKWDSSVKIIFMTTSSEFAVESYTVGAYFYQLKPIYFEALASLLDNVILELDNEQDHSLIIRCKTGISRIPIPKLMYCEVLGRTLLYHMANGAIFESIGSMQDLKNALLPFPRFLSPHRSFLINMDYISNITYKEILLLNQTRIPIPRGRYSKIKESFLAYAFSEGRPSV